MTLRISGKKQSASARRCAESRSADRTEEVLRKYFDGNFIFRATSR